jgi:hypothetical protein
MTCEALFPRAQRQDAHGSVESCVGASGRDEGCYIVTPDAHNIHQAVNLCPLHGDGGGGGVCAEFNE